MKGWQALPEERCGNCRYFRKHYIRSYEECYLATNYGHCTYPRLKKRRAEECCPHWTAADEENPRSP